VGVSEQLVKSRTNAPLNRKKSFLISTCVPF
jgi:hypothetical protein